MVRLATRLLLDGDDEMVVKRAKGEGGRENERGEARRAREASVVSVCPLWRSRQDCVGPHLFLLSLPLPILTTAYRANHPRTPTPVNRFTPCAASSTLPLFVFLPSVYHAHAFTPTLLLLPSPFLYPLPSFAMFLYFVSSSIVPRFTRFFLLLSSYAFRPLSPFLFFPPRRLVRQRPRVNRSACRLILVIALSG